MPMEATDLTCAKCGATWKLIKASADRILCPYCNAPVEIAATEKPADSKPAETAAPAPNTEPIVASIAVASAQLASPAEPTAPPQEQLTPPPEEPSIPATVRVIDVPDTESDDYDDGVDL